MKGMKGALNSSDINNPKGTVINGCPKDSLADLRDVRIDTRKAVPDRMLDYIKQIKNPYFFKVDDVGVRVSFGAERSFTDALRSAIVNGINYQGDRS